MSHSGGLALTIPGKSLKQLEDWCKQYAHEEWTKVKGTKDRYTYVQIVQKAQKKMREEDGIEESEEEPSSATAGRRKSRISLGYEDGQPAPASPRVKRKSTSTTSTTPAVAGSKRKSRSATVEDTEEMDEREHESVSEASTPPTKKSRTTGSTPTRAKTSAKRTTTRTRKGATKKKGDHSSDDDSEMHDGDESEDTHMSDAGSGASQAPFPTATLVIKHSQPFMDESVFAKMGSPHKVTRAEEEDTDVKMRSPTPSPPIAATSPPAPSVANPFQKSPLAPSTSSSRSTSDSPKPTARQSMGPLTSTTSVSSSFLPFTSSAAQPRSKSLAPSPFAMEPTSKYQPLQSTPLTFDSSRRSSGTHDVTGPPVFPSSVPSQPLSLEDIDRDYGSQFVVPDYIPSMRKSYQSPSTGLGFSASSQAASTGYGSSTFSPQESTLRQRFAPWSEEKYPQPTSTVTSRPLVEPPSAVRDDEAYVQPLPTPSPSAHARRYSDRVKGLPEIEES